MTGAPAEGAGAVVSDGMDRCIADAISAGWAWSVFGPMSSAGPLAMRDRTGATVKAAR